ncbi:MAG TPA: NAD-dependent epimerase, partial [Baekduia sp.]|nr:NAD-dependent epimerase [Baekduia sp.]
GGKQVRDNIHAVDVVSAFHEFHRRPRSAAVYNLGGGRASNVSMLEAIEKCQRIAGRELQFSLASDARIGDHQWYISDFSDFQREYPAWCLTHEIDDVLTEIYEHNADHWAAS